MFSVLSSASQVRHNKAIDQSSMLQAIELLYEAHQKKVTMNDILKSCATDFGRKEHVDFIQQLVWIQRTEHDQLQEYTEQILSLLELKGADDAFLSLLAVAKLTEAPNKQFNQAYELLFMPSLLAVLNWSFAEHQTQFNRNLKKILTLDKHLQVRLMAWYQKQISARNWQYSDIKSVPVAQSLLLFEAFISNDVAAKDRLLTNYLKTMVEAQAFDIGLLQLQWFYRNKLLSKGQLLTISIAATQIFCRRIADYRQPAAYRIANRLNRLLTESSGKTNAYAIWQDCARENPDLLSQNTALQLSVLLNLSAEIPVTSSEQILTEMSLAHLMAFRLESELLLHFENFSPEVQYLVSKWLDEHLQRKMFDSDSSDETRLLTLKIGIDTLLGTINMSYAARILELTGNWRPLKLVAEELSSESHLQQQVLELEAMLASFEKSADGNK
ncbi:hypothetical protein MACH26_13930 [Planctobacterium marinum]|uniref:Uncharacterized protein n=1 Tax=Planctobacterium marinum TaxID=1631968 RepID=A0AA48HLR2_9ALTE|nr:hypothetical protein MACH26_13930 [Planctobacterium marinum]